MFNNLYVLFITYCRNKVKSLSRVRLFATPWTAACQAPLSMGFSRQEYWRGLLFSSPGIFPTQGSNPGLPHCQFSHSVMSDSLQPHKLQHSRPPCPSPTPEVHSDSHPMSRWCHPDISSSVIPFSSRPQSCLASESFPMSQLFAWGGEVLEFQL